MHLDEATAYAIAAWQRFDHDVDDDVIRAVCGAFAIVATADGDLDARETTAFLDTVRKHFSISTTHLDLIEHGFRDLAHVLLTDPEAGRRHAVSEIRRVAGSKSGRALVRSAARLAVVADGRTDSNETSALAEVLEALGDEME